MLGSQEEGCRLVVKPRGASGAGENQRGPAVRAGGVSRAHHLLSLKRGSSELPRVVYLAVVLLEGRRWGGSCAVVQRITLWAVVLWTLGGGVCR